LTNECYGGKITFLSLKTQKTRGETMKANINGKNNKKFTSIVEIRVKKEDKEALCGGVVAKVRPILAELDLWRRNSMSSSVRL
jgi:hypothetical protein